MPPLSLPSSRAILDTCGTSSDTIIRPILADFVDRLEVQRLQVGRARVTLRFERFSEGVAVKVRKVEEL
jgi:hypothetical protein